MSAINSKDLKYAKSVVVSSLNKATQGNLEMYGSAVLDIGHQLPQARVSNDLDLEIAVNKSKRDIKKIFKNNVFSDLQEAGYTPSRLRVSKKYFMVETIKKMFGRLEKRQYSINFNLKNSENQKTCFHLHLNNGALSGCKEQVEVNNQKVKIPSISEALNEKILILLEHTKKSADSIYKNRPIYRFLVDIFRLSTGAPRTGEPSSRGKYIYDIAVLAKNDKCQNINELVKDLITKGEKRKLSMESLEEIKNYPEVHKSTFEQDVSLYQGKPSSFDDYWKFTIDFIEKLREEITKSKT